MSKQLYFKEFSLAEIGSLNIKTVQLEVIQFGISAHFSYIWPIDNIQLVVFSLGQCGPWSDCNEWVIRIPQTSIIKGTSPSDQ